VHSPEWIPTAGTIHINNDNTTVDINCSELVRSVNGHKVHGTLTLIRVGTLH
jgi:hypothetical protein